MCFGQKELIKVQFFRFWSALIKVQSIPQVLFETTRSGFIQVLHHCSMSMKIGLVKNHQITHAYLKPQVSFSLKFASLFSDMRDNSSVPF